MVDWSDDLVLRALQDLEEPVGSLVRAYPGRSALAENPDWIEDWFVELARRFAAGDGPDPVQIIASAADQGDLSLLAKPPVRSSICLTSIHPQYFRGFRDLPEPILFDADLVVVEGRNSSGKTSLCEAIEWALTGQLSRRTSGEHGHARELADCISNEFRPANEPTSVEIVLLVDGERLLVKRVLTRDYSTTASDEPLSDVFLNGQSLDSRQERDLQERLLAGVHPILMQHDLRRFVHDHPDARRQYFERILQVDELTGLIEKAVVGTQRLKQLTRPGGGAGLAALRTLVAELEKKFEGGEDLLVSDFRRLERLSSEKVSEALPDLLIRIAGACFPSLANGAETLSQWRESLIEAQRAQREARLPLLAGLAESSGRPAPSLDHARGDLKGLVEALTATAGARKAAAKFSEAQLELARVAERLIAAGLIDSTQPEAQVCPLCETSPGTLSSERVAELVSRGPLVKELEQAESGVREAQVSAQQRLVQIRAAASSVVPSIPATKQIAGQLAEAPDRVASLSKVALESGREVQSRSEEVLQALDRLADLVRPIQTAPAELHQQVDATQLVLGKFADQLLVHREHVAQLEEAVGAVARDDAEYRLRQDWLELVGLVSSLEADLAWEAAKALAKSSLDGLRNGLIELRTSIIEEARQRFSDEMTTIWKLLRSDSGARFNRLHVPSARGRGYKLEFELKAVISDGESEPEVEALRVFSESQVNVVGLAAYITRAKLLGHKLLIFDDPVQSMDEEHFRSFSASLLPELLDDGLQVLVLTHSDAFARRVNDHHYLRESYATIETRSSRRKGCYVLEGSRRVSERLKNARRLAQDGDLPGAWRLVRIAIERMYTLAKASEDEGFDAQSWQGLTAEDMWNRGVQEIVERRAPGSGHHLKEILAATSMGAHDKAATSETDLVEASRRVGALLTPLRLGAG